MGQASAGERPWFVQAFERLYLRLYVHRSDDEAESHAPLLRRLLELRVGHRVLDVACGAGRHARALARRGYRVTGVDLSADLLEEARQRSPDVPGTPTYVRWDIRELPFVLQFEAAVSMFTSFGYFGARTDDQRILEGVHRALIPGGRFLLDFLNEKQVRGSLEPETTDERDGLSIRMRRWIDEEAPDGPRVHKHVFVQDGNTGREAAEYEESVRLYTAEEVDELLGDAGFDPLGNRLGDYDERPWDASSPRLIRVARKCGS